MRAEPPRAGRDGRTRRPPRRPPRAGAPRRSAARAAGSCSRPTSSSSGRTRLASTVGADGPSPRRRSSALDRDPRRAVAPRVLARRLDRRRVVVARGDRRRSRAGRRRSRARRSRSPSRRARPRARARAAARGTAASCGARRCRTPGPGRSRGRARRRPAPAPTAAARAAAAPGASTGRWKAFQRSAQSSGTSLGGDVDERAAGRRAHLAQVGQLARRAVEHVLDRVGARPRAPPGRSGASSSSSASTASASARPTRTASRITAAPARRPPTLLARSARPRACRASAGDLVRALVQEAGGDQPLRRAVVGARRAAASSGRLAITVGAQGGASRRGRPHRAHVDAVGRGVGPDRLEARGIDLDRGDRREAEPRGGDREHAAAGAPVATAPPAGSTPEQQLEAEPRRSGARRRRTPGPGRSRGRCRRRAGDPTAGGRAAAGAGTSTGAGAACQRSPSRRHLASVDAPTSASPAAARRSASGGQLAGRAVERVLDRVRAGVALLQRRAGSELEQRGQHDLRVGARGRATREPDHGRRQPASARLSLASMPSSRAQVVVGQRVGELLEQVALLAVEAGAGSTR